MSRDEHSGSAERHRRLDDATAWEACLTAVSSAWPARMGPARPRRYGSHPRIAGYQVGVAEA